MINSMSGFRIAIVIVLSLLPWPAVWFGMYKLNSLIWTFFLYHIVVMLPAIIWGWRLWKPHVLMPSNRQWIVAVVTTALSTVIGITAYRMTGDVIVSKVQVMQVLTLRGFQAAYLLPLGVYFVVINATLEELFWRGVILNELEYLSSRVRHFGYAWTAVAFGAWHWLVLSALLKPGWAELAVCGVVLMGFFTSWLYRRTQSIVLPIIWHAFVFDFAIIALFAVLVRT
jgi:membrane protease YdiL (CAAX protease family)